MVGILSFKEEAAYGLDTTRFHKMFCINNRYYEVDRVLYVSGSLQGPSTVVHDFTVCTHADYECRTSLGYLMLSRQSHTSASHGISEVDDVRRYHSHPRRAYI